MMLSKPSPSFLYVISSEVGLVKIGISQDVKKRFRTLEAESPCRLVLVHQRWHSAANMVEDLIKYEILAEDRHHAEWFNVTTDRAVMAIDEAISRIEAGVVCAAPRVKNIDPKAPRPGRDNRGRFVLKGGSIKEQHHV